MRYLFLLIILVPAADIGLLLFSGKTLGVIPTVTFIILTGVIGAYFAKKQGLQTIRKAQEQLRFGEIPGEAILDGICILVGATLLITPGFITDFLGFLLLFPFTRRFFKLIMKSSFRRRINRGNIKIIK
ncbi:FxsA family protein [Neobacillus sp. PS3-40]|uniref:FxsA family protein n=1 Tax=Neobacillus sp. PS3-40 TaxID=3070679 RepID=UPI0027E1B438|nr:FxsA family protein [Neobacillus sp. PS3-40]WML45635.1 FxsA family protein [Neobacillus sp. PS3-40]